MKQVLNSINDKVGQLDTDVAELKKAPELIESGKCDGTTNSIVFEHGLIGAHEVYINIVSMPGSDTSDATIMFFDGQDTVATGTLSDVVMTNPRGVDIHLSRVRDGRYHIDMGTGPSTGSLTQGGGGTGHIYWFDKVSIILATGNFPEGTIYELYVK